MPKPGGVKSVVVCSGCGSDESRVYFELDGLRIEGIWFECLHCGHVAYHSVIKLIRIKAN